MDVDLDNHTNTNCKNCINCIGCINCENCVNCVGCINCIECEECISCFDCRNCDKCSDCKECFECQSCDKCYLSNNCHSCEEGFNVEHRINYCPFSDARYSFPKTGCCDYNPILENFLLNHKFEEYNSTENYTLKEGLLIAWNYGISYRRYWYAIESSRHKFEIFSLLEFILRDKLYYNEE
jgi:hypothetical protein